MFLSRAVPVRAPPQSSPNNCSDAKRRLFSSGVLLLCQAQGRISGLPTAVPIAAAGCIAACGMLGQPSAADRTKGECARKAGFVVEAAFRFWRQEDWPAAYRILCNRATLAGSGRIAKLLQMKNEKPELKRALKNRHVQLIALGGAIGTGLFLGSAGTIQMAGPAVLISYALGGFIAFMIMRQLGEMMAQEPVAGSFSNLAHKYWGDFPGLLSGWNYWILYVLVGKSELSAVAVYVQYWFPSIPAMADHGLFLPC